MESRIRVVPDDSQSGTELDAGFKVAQQQGPDSEETEGTSPPYIISPNAPWKVRWDLLIGAMIIYSTISVPFFIGFGVESAGAFQTLDVIVDIFFGLDLIASFRTAYLDSVSGTLVRTPKLVAWHYVKTWFPIDLISTLPIDKIAPLFMSSNASGSALRSMKLVRIVRLARLFKIFKLMKIGDAIEDIEHLIPGILKPVLDVSFMILMIIFIAHLLACIWFALTSLEPEEHGTTWLRGQYGEKADDLSISLKYVASLYWAITTMATVGYGDIGTKNNSERAYAIFVMLIGSSTFGYTLGMMSSMVQNSDVEAAEKKRRKENLKEYMIHAGIPKALQQRLRRHWRYFQQHKTIFDEARILKTVPPGFRAKLLREGNNQKMSLRIPRLLGDRDVYFLELVVPKLHPLCLENAEVVFQEGAIGWHCYWVISGRIDLTFQKEGNSAITFESKRNHDLLGENFVISGKVSPCCATGTSNSELTSMHKCDVQLVFEEWPSFQEEIQSSWNKFEMRLDKFKADAQSSNPKEQERKASVRDSDAERTRGSVACDVEFSPATLWKTHRLLHPENEKKIVWDLLIGVFIIYSVVAVPFRIAFSADAVGVGLAVDSIMDILFAVDMVLAFNTTYKSDSGVYIVKRSLIRENYFKSSFTIDFLSTVPMDRLMGAFTNNGSQLRLFKLFRIFRLGRIAKLAKLLQNGPVQEKIDDLTSQINSAVFKLPVLYLLLLFCAHIFGCVWYGVSESGWRQPNSTNWGTNYYGERSCDDPTEVPGDVLCGTTISTEERYLTSVYWAITTMTTVGYGDIGPNVENVSEMIFAMLAMLLGTTIFAYVVGEVVTAVMNLDPAANLLKQQKQTLKDYLISTGFHVQQKRNAFKNIKYQVDVHTIFNSAELFDMMPEFLLSQVIIANNAKIIDRYCVAFDEKFKTAHLLIIPELQPFYCASQQYLFDAGQRITQMFFLEKGSCISERPPSVAGGEWAEVKQFKSGDHIAEICPLLPKASTFTMALGVKATSEVLVLALGRSAMEKMAVMCPALRQHLNAIWNTEESRNEWLVEGKQAMTQSLRSEVHQITLQT